MVQVSVRELKEKLSEYIRRAEGGEKVVVTRRGKAVASLGQSATAAMTTEEKLADLERRGILSRPKRPFNLPPLIPLQGEGPSVSEMMLRDRGEPVP